MRVQTRQDQHAAVSVFRSVGRPVCSSVRPLVLLSVCAVCLCSREYARTRVRDLAQQEQMQLQQAGSAADQGWPQHIQAACHLVPCVRACVCVHITPVGCRSPRLGRHASCHEHKPNQSPRTCRHLYTTLEVTSHEHEMFEPHVTHKLFDDSDFDMQSRPQLPRQLLVASWRRRHCCLRQS